VGFWARGVHTTARTPCASAARRPSTVIPSSSTGTGTARYPPRRTIWMLERKQGSSRATASSRIRAWASRRSTASTAPLVRVIRRSAGVAGDVGRHPAPGPVLEVGVDDGFAVEHGPPGRGGERGAQVRDQAGVGVAGAQIVQVIGAGEALLGRRRVLGDAGPAASLETTTPELARVR
jgi:hypothetical protein